jgi:hypothetical protein
MIKSWKMKWEGNVECSEEMRNSYKIVVEDLKQRGHLEDLCVDREILKQILRQLDRMVWSAFI